MDIIVARDDYSGPFFDGCARGELLMRYCPPCGTFAAAQIRDCPRCGTDLEWKPTNGRGTVVTWSLLGTETAGTQVAAGIIELDEGPWLYARTATQEVRAGLRVRAEFARPNQDDAGEFVPVFVDVEPATRTAIA